MSTVRNIIEGWAKKDGDIWDAVPNTVLLDTGKKKVLVDPGNHPKLIEILERKSIWPEEIDTVFITHTHLDHIKNLALFPFAEIIDICNIHKDTSIVPHDGKIPGTDVRIIPTPGHTCDHSSLIAETKEGRVMICGDLFWWEEDREIEMNRENLLNLPDEFASDPIVLLKSRTEALNSGSVLYIPGHGRPFKIRTHDL